jgi:hypothetical protein
MLGSPSMVLLHRRQAMGGLAMLTTILAYVIALAGLVMIAAGAWGLFILLSAETARPRYYAIAIGMSGGLGMIGLAQALRLLLEINAKVPLPIH